MINRDTTPIFKTESGAHFAGKDTQSFLSALVSLKQASAAHLSMNELSLERCRLAAEWRQTVQEQGSLLITTLRRRMQEITRSADYQQRVWVDSSGQSGNFDKSIAIQLFEEHKRLLREDITKLVDVHVELDESMQKLALMLVDIVAISDKVLSCSDRIRSNELVKKII